MKNNRKYHEILEGGLRTKGKKSSNRKPLFSIITIVFNDIKNIEETILSVINQTYKNFEYIVVDGGSTDGTVDIIKKYESKISYWISEKDGGIYPAMNKGIKLAAGEVINMINCGDYYPNNKILQNVSEHILKNKNISFVLGLTKFINDDGSDYLINHKQYFSTLKAGRFNTISHQAFFYKKKLHEEFGLYNTKYSICADGHFMYRVYHSKKHKKKLVQKIFAIRRREGASQSAKSVLEHKKMYDEIFGRSILHELLLIKYVLKLTKLGRFLYKIYLRIRIKIQNRS